MKKVILKEGRERSLLRYHPWVFSGAIARCDEGIAIGDIVELFAADGAYVGCGHYADSSIAVKMLKFAPERFDETFWHAAVKRSFELRATLGLTNNLNTTAYRLINSEGDGLPGLVVDIYGQAAVIQCHSIGMLRARTEICEALREMFGDNLTACIDKSSETINEASPEVRLTDKLDCCIWGTAPDPLIKEGGLAYRVDWHLGQKTGFFLDQRDNRMLLKNLASEKRVLNAFSYTGAFTVNAVAGGASFVCSVDSSKSAMQLLEENVQLNFSNAHHQGIVADYFSYINTLTDEFDLIILDPPAFAKHRGAVKGAIAGYRGINASAMTKLRRGGVLFTFSCSQLISREMFFDVIVHSALRTGKKVRVLHELHQAACHPVSVFHPEGSYLKGFVLEVR